MAFRSTAAELNRQYNQNRNDIEELYEQGKQTNAKIDALAANVDARFDGVNARFDGVEATFSQIDARFDRLEQLIAQQSGQRDPSSTHDFLPPPDEQRLSLLETKMNLYSRYTLDHAETLTRHSRMFDAHEARFDALDGQMAEVLSILRSKPA